LKKQGEKTRIFLSKECLLFGVTVGVLIGYLPGTIINRVQIDYLQHQISTLRLQVEQLRGAVPPLRTLAEKHGIYIGATVGADQLSIKEYVETLMREFDILTTENALKFERVHPERYFYSFTEADRIIAFAEANGMKVRGHTLVWHHQLPARASE